VGEEGAQGDRHRRLLPALSLEDHERSHRRGLVEFDALSHYKKYTDIFDIDGVPEEERHETARGVADWVLASLENA
jgi:hypothetical protein